MTGQSGVVGQIGRTIAFLLAVGGFVTGIWKFNDLDKSRSETKEQVASLSARLNQLELIRQGPRGEAGPAGPPGPKGDPAPAANIKVLEEQITALTRELAVLKRQKGATTDAALTAPAQRQAAVAGGLVKPASARCFILAPGKRSETFLSIKPGDFLCDHQDRPFLFIGEFVERGAIYLDVRDATREQRCFQDQICEVSTPGVFVGVVKFMRLFNYPQVEVTRQ